MLSRSSALWLALLTASVSSPHASAQTVYQDQTVSFTVPAGLETCAVKGCKAAWQSKLAGGSIELELRHLPKLNNSPAQVLARLEATAEFEKKLPKHMTSNRDELFVLAGRSGHKWTSSDMTGTGAYEETMENTDLKGKTVTTEQKVEAVVESRADSWSLLIPEKNGNTLSLTIAITNPTGQVPAAEVQQTTRMLADLVTSFRWK